MSYLSSSTKRHHSCGIAIALLLMSSLILLQATAPGLEQKLGKLAPAHAVAGYIAPYFVERFVAFYYMCM